MTDFSNVIAFSPRVHLSAALSGLDLLAMPESSTSPEEFAKSVPPNEIVTVREVAHELVTKVFIGPQDSKNRGYWREVKRLLSKRDDGKHQ